MGGQDTVIPTNSELGKTEVLNDWEKRIPEAVPKAFKAFSTGTKKLIKTRRC